MSIMHVHILYTKFHTDVAINIIHNKITNKLMDYA